MRRRVAYLPIEFSARELDGKILLARELVRRDVDVIIGQQWKIQACLPKLPSGAILFKSYHRIYRDVMRYCKSRDFRVFALEEELFATDEKSGVNQVVSDGFDGFVDVIFAQSRAEFEAVREKSKNVSIIKAGNLRADILKSRNRKMWERQLNKIKNEKPKYILINTNFGNTNSGWGDPELPRKAAIQSGVLVAGNSESEALFEGSINYELHVRSVLEAAVAELLGRGGEVILRPHPGESLDYWINKYRGCKGVSVIREGSHVPWTLAAEALLHGGCTTGFEAAVAGIPAFSVSMNGNPYADMLISNRVNLCAESPGELLNLMSANRAETLAAQSSRLSESGFFGLSPDSDNVNIIADHVCSTFDDEIPKWDARFEKIRLLFSGPEVKQLQRKCNFDMDCIVDGFEAANICDGLKVSAEFAEVGESIVLVRPEARRYFYVKNDLVRRYAPASLARLIKEKGALSEVDYREFVSVNRADFLKNPDGISSHIDWCVAKGLWDEAWHWALQLDSIVRRMSVGASLRFARIASAVGEPKQALEALKPIWHDICSLELALEFRGAGLPVSTLAVVGDSHIMYFSEKFLFPGSRRLWMLSKFVFGGASAFGLMNKESDSGARLGIEKSFEQILLHDQIVINFGEVDCRRAAWVRAARHGKSINDCLSDSVAGLLGLIDMFPRERLADLLVVGAKPALLDTATMEAITRYDNRCVASGLEDRVAATRVFNKKLSSECYSLGVRFLDPADFLCEGSYLEYLREAMFCVFDDDVHGNLPFFSRGYARLVDTWLSERFRGHV